MAGVLAALLLAAAAVVGLALVLFSAYLGRAMRGMLDALAEGRFDLRDPAGPPTAEAAARRTAAERLGFGLVLDRELALDGDEQRLLLLWRPDGTMVEVSQRASGDGRAKTSVLTALDPGGGVLATQDVYGLYTVDHELKQVFPDADVDRLVAEHDRALGWLAGEGLTPHAVDRARTFEVYGRILRRAGAAHPRKRLLFYRLARAEEAGRTFGDEGSIVGSPTSAAKVAAMRAAGTERPWD